jgi:hypothetical protein
MLLSALAVAELEQQIPAGVAEQMGMAALA